MTNGASTVKTVAAGMKWDVLDDERQFLVERLAPVLDGTVEPVSQQVIKQSRVRTVTRIEMPGGRVVFVKHYRTVRPLDRLLFSTLPHRSRSRREWRVIRSLQEKAPGVLVPRAIAIGMRREGGFIRSSRLVLDEISGATPVGTELERGGFSASERISIIKQLNALTARVTAAGLYHRDFHLGNILISRHEGIERLALIDLHAARVGPWCTRRQRNRMLARMWHSLDTCGVVEDECVEFVRCVVGDNAFPETLESVRRLVRRWTVRRWKSRSRRCVKDSTKFEQGRLPSGRYSVMRAFGLDTLRRAIDVHRQGSAETVTTLKRSGQGHVTAATLEPGQRVCVKEVRAKGLRKWLKTVFRQGRGRRAWTAVNGLAARGFAVPHPYGYLSERTGLMDKTEYVVTQYLGECPSLEDYVETPAYTDAPPLRKRGFAEAFARYLATLHERGVHQHDFKANNVLVEESEDGRWTFYLVDLDSVGFVGSVSKNRRVKNLGQLASALSNNVTAAQRLRFLRAYARAAHLEWNERTVVRQVFRIVSGRGGPWRMPTAGSAGDG